MAELVIGGQASTLSVLDTEPRDPHGSVSGGAHDMRIGASIFLIALGAILTFAVERDISGLDIDVIGVILMLAGALGLFMFMLVWGRAGARRRTTRPGEVIEVIEEQRGYEDPPL